MANHESAAKANRQAERRKLRNRSIKSAVKTQLRAVEGLVVSGTLDNSEDALKRATAAYDRAAQKGVLHPNNAARHKSRLMKKYNAALKTAPPEAVAVSAVAKPAPRRRAAAGTPKAVAAKAPSPKAAAPKGVAAKAAASKAATAAKAPAARTTRTAKAKPGAS